MGRDLSNSDRRGQSSQSGQSWSEFEGKSTMYQGLTDLPSFVCGDVRGELLGLGMVAVGREGVDENNQGC